VESEAPHNLAGLAIYQESTGAEFVPFKSTELVLVIRHTQSRSPARNTGNIYPRN